MKTWRLQEVTLTQTRARTPDVAVLPIGGHFTMDPKGAALAASYVKARTVIPMHFQTFPVIPGSPEELKDALKGGAKVQVLEPGVAATF